MVSASHWVGLIFPGMIDDPGSLAGIRSSAKPARGPHAYQRTSLAIFMSAPARVRSAALTSTIASCADGAANLLGSDTKGLPVSSAIRRAFHRRDGSPRSLLLVRLRSRLRLAVSLCGDPGAHVPRAVDESNPGGLRARQKLDRRPVDQGDV